MRFVTFNLRGLGRRVRSVRLLRGAGEGDVGRQRQRPSAGRPWSRLRLLRYDNRQPGSAGRTAWTRSTRFVSAVIQLHSLLRSPPAGLLGPSSLGRRGGEGGGRVAAAAAASLGSLSVLQLAAGSSGTGASLREVWTHQSVFLLALVQKTHR